MTTITNAAPKSNLLGIKDESRGAPVIEPEALPTHLPHVFIFAERGPTEPQLVVGDSLTRMYGARSLDYRSPYANHQTVLLNTVNGNGNACLVQRVIPEDAAPPAGMALYLDLLETQIPVYERNTDGSIARDENGDPIQQEDGGGEPITVSGYKGKWVVGPLQKLNSDGEVITGGMSGSEAVPVANAIGQQSTQTGDQTDEDTSVESTRYPIMELEASHIGAYGDRLGVRLSAPTVKSSVPIKDTVVLDQLSYLFRLQFVERPVNTSTPRTIETNFGDQYVDFSFKEGTIDKSVDKELYADRVILPSYEDLDTPGTPPKFGPFGKTHIYQSYVDEVLDRLYQAEQPENDELPTSEEEDARYVMNLLTGVDMYGNEYHTYQVAGPSEGGLLLNTQAAHYASGGADGTLSFGNFDSLVGNLCENYGDGEFNLLDTAMYPQSVIYDTGFTIDTKKKLLTPIGRRKDICVVLSTQDVSQRQNTQAEESSTAIALRAAARVYPESEIYGTSVCRAIVMGQSGYLLNSQYKGLMPLTIDLAQKFSSYMGAGEGIWQTTEKFDEPGNNQVTMFRVSSVNGAYKPANARSRDWDNGLVWVQNYDRSSLFYPGIQTVYDDDTSILNSAANMFVAVELEKVADRVWRDLTGISYLTTEQFIERSDELIEQRTTGRFDDRVVIVPETFLTEDDSERGFSWSCRINMYGNNMRTVGTFTIVARRRDDLEQ